MMMLLLDQLAGCCSRRDNHGNHSTCAHSRVGFEVGIKYSVMLTPPPMSIHFVSLEFGTKRNKHRQVAASRWDRHSRCVLASLLLGNWN